MFTPALASVRQTFASTPGLDSRLMTSCVALGIAVPSSRSRGTSVGAHSIPFPVRLDHRAPERAPDEAPSRFGDADGLQPLPRYGIPTGRPLARTMLTYEAR